MEATMRSETDRTAVVVTASYATAPGDMTIVVTSVGIPRGMTDAPRLEGARPFDIYGKGFTWPEYIDRYVQRIADNWLAVQRDLDRLTAEHGNLALCCFCRDASRCHRRLLADHIEHMTGMIVPEQGPVTIPPQAELAEAMKNHIETTHFDDDREDR
jgi:hypothetical protein